MTTTIPKTILNVLATGILFASPLDALLAADTLQFVSRFVTATENSGSVKLQVTRVGTLTNVAMVDYTTLPLTATPGVDYEAGVGQLTFQAGESNQTISIALLDDAVQEGAEGFNVLLTNPVGAILGRFTNTSVNLTDNEKPFLVDPTFDPGAGGNNNPQRILALPNGQVLVAGSFSEYQGLPRQGLVRLNADGSIDASFDPGLNGCVFRLSHAPDDKIVIAGEFTISGGEPRNGLARLNADGSLDLSFAPGDWLGENSVVSTVLAQPDGKVIVCGFFSSIHGQPRNHVARLNADGSLDATFDAGMPDGSVADAVLQSDGRLVLCGFFNAINGESRSHIARLESDGSLDSSYAPVTQGRPNGPLPFLIRRLALRADDKVFIQGDRLEAVNGVARRIFALLNADGSLAQDFVPSGFVGSLVNFFTALPNGGLLVGGATSTLPGGDYAFGRFNPDGSFDPTFDPELASTGIDARVMADGNYFVSGFFNEIGGMARPGLARLFSSGAGRFGFNFVGTGAATNENAGHILVNVQRRGESSAGASVSVSALEGTALAGTDFLAGGVTVTFAPLETHKAVAVPLVDDRAPEPEEKFNLSLAGGGPGALFGRSSSVVWILDNDRAGSVDRAVRFSVAGVGIPALTDVAAVQPLPGGKFLAAVFGFDSLTFTFSGAVARFNGNGSPDLTFPPYALDTFTGPSQITPMAGGRSMLINRGDRLVRLRADGSEDPSFSVVVTPAEGDAAYISDVLVQPDQKIVVAGRFASVNGVARHNIARVRVTGALDVGFEPGPGPDDTVIALALEPDGKLVLGGWFLKIGNHHRAFLARLHANGSFDRTLDPKESFTDPSGGLPLIQSINVQRDGRLLISGVFDSYQGEPRFSLVRVHSNGRLDRSFDIGSGFGAPGDPATPAYVAGTAVQPDRKILVTGNYATFDGALATGLVRLNREGSLDPTFQLTATTLPLDSGSVFVGPPPVLLPDGDILIAAFGGSRLFSFNGVTRVKGDPQEKMEK